MSQPSVVAIAIHANASVVSARAAKPNTPSTASFPAISELAFRATRVDGFT